MPESIRRALPSLVAAACAIGLLGWEISRHGWAFFFQITLNGITLGAVYALIALGYTMVYGILLFINFAHSDIFMMGAWISYLVSKAAGWTQRNVVAPAWSIFVVLLAAMAVCGTVGFAIERLA